MAPQQSPASAPYRRGSRHSLQPFALALGGLCVFVLCVGCGGVDSSGLEGSVTATRNPQVAVYTVTPQQSGDVTIFFGKTTSYGLQTWTRQTQPGGYPVSIYVAGMQANTVYHMQAVVKYGDGTTVKDRDRTFKTGSYPASWLPSITTTTTSGQTPQPGIEMLNPTESPMQIAAVDLSGNVIWAYTPPVALEGTWLAPKQLPDGDFIALASTSSSTILKSPPPAGAANLVREFDLAGNTIKQITMTQLNARWPQRITT